MLDSDTGLYLVSPTIFPAVPLSGNDPFEEFLCELRQMAISSDDDARDAGRKQIACIDRAELPVALRVVRIARKDRNTEPALETRFDDIEVGRGQLHVRLYPGR